MPPKPKKIPMIKSLDVAESWVRNEKARMAAAGRKVPLRVLMASSMMRELAGDTCGVGKLKMLAGLQVWADDTVPHGDLRILTGSIDHGETY